MCLCARIWPEYMLSTELCHLKRYTKWEQPEGKYQCSLLKRQTSGDPAFETLSTVALRAHWSPIHFSLHPYSQPSSLVCLLGKWLTDASRGSSACCWAPSGLALVRWCWPGASAGSPATYPETGGECAEGEKQDAKIKGNVLVGHQNPRCIRSNTSDMLD